VRKALIFLPLAMVAAPAAAAPAPQPHVDPAMADRMTDVLQRLSESMMDLPIGELQAAVEGRQPTPADRQRRLRDLEPGLDRDIHTQIAQSRPRIRQGMQALSDAMPAMQKSLEDMRRSLERAMSNMPDPTYPKR
jgi:hypothetical protein